MNLDVDIAEPVCAGGGCAGHADRVGAVGAAVAARVEVRVRRRGHVGG